MPVLSKTELTGKIVWLGRVADRNVTLRSDPVDRLQLGFDGVEGEYHSGLTRRSCARVLTQYPKGTEIRNTRQISLVSEEEVAATAETLGIPEICPEWIGATVVVRGLPDFTLVPPSSRLVFENGTSLTVDMENAPCIFPAREIDQHHPGVGKNYKTAARHRRGITAWVERPGVLETGARFHLHVPPQRLYPHI
ncbi:MAG: sulfurase [Pseudomonadota bacterium]